MIDRYPRVRILWVSAAVSIGSLVVTAFVPNYELLVLTHSVRSIALQAIWMTMISILGDAYLPEWRGRALMVIAPRRRLLITVGELEDRINPEEARACAALKIADAERNVREANMAENAAALATELRALGTCGLQVAFVQFPGETHNSAIPAYLARGARFTLSGWFD